MRLASALALSLVSFGTLVSCTDTTTTTPSQLNLDRPVDIAFACWGGLRLTAEPGRQDEVIASPQPLESCNVRSQPKASSEAKPPRPPGQEDRDGTAPGDVVGNAFWYGLILQSEPGTIAVAKFDTKPSSAFVGSDVAVLDADRLTPGKNGISVGEDPVAIATDKVGCFALTANAGSCDLSVIDINTVVVNAENDPNAPDPTVSRLDVKDGSGRVIRAKPAAMAFEPAAGTIGLACPAQPTGLAYIAYPSCHLVAGVDVSTGTIVTGVQFDAAGTASIITDPSTISCNDECGVAAAATPGPRPVAIDLELDKRTGRAILAIGADNSSVLNVVQLDPNTFVPQSLLPAAALEDTTTRLGVTSLSVSPVIGMGGTSGVVDDEGTPFQHQFVYAVATDGTVRVVDITAVPHECDTQIDPRFLHDVRDIDRLSCFSVADPTNPPRRALAKSPGIELIGDAIPMSTDFVTVEDSPSNVPGTPVRMIGHFAVITAANGQTYTVNVDNDDFADFEPPIVGGGVEAPIPLDIAHQLRDGIPDRNLLAQTADGKFVCDDAGPDPDSQSGNAGGPRSVGNPVLNIPTNTIAAEKSGGLPSIRQVRCVSEEIDDTTMLPEELPVTELGFSAPVGVRELEFPDLMGLRNDENWTLTWEGSLSLDNASTAIDGPATRFGQLYVDATGMRLNDASRPFCDAGVEPFDILQLRGCDPSLGDAGCPLGYTCFVHPQSQVSGLGACMLTDEAERLATTCSEFLRSLRRYTVATTKTGELLLMARKAELRTTPLDGCTDDAQCEALADYALKTTSSANPVSDTTGADPKSYACQIDNARAPKAGTGKRCLMTCDTDADCAGGTVCHLDQASTRAGYCMEGVIPPQSCVNGLQRYEMRVGEAFAVLGSRQGFMHPIIADAGGNCVRNPDANPFQIGRLPLTAPDCLTGADPRTGRLPDGTPEPNPCKLTVDETEFQLNYDQTDPTACKLASDDEKLVTRQAEAIQFRNRGMKLTVVDPTYQGDAVCVGDRGGSLVNVPLVVPGYQIAFRQTAGFSPLLLPIQPSFPVKVVRGPQESIWVMDAGDFLSTSLSVASTRGKVFRVESRAIGVTNILQ